MAEFSPHRVKALDQVMYVPAELWLRVGRTRHDMVQECLPVRSPVGFGILCHRSLGGEGEIVGECLEGGEGTDGQEAVTVGRGKEAPRPTPGSEEVTDAGMV